MKKHLKTLITIVMSVLIFSVALSAEGLNNRITVRTGESGTHDSQNTTDTETYSGNIDSGTDGHISNNNSDKADVNVPNTVESVVDGAVNDVSDAVNDAQNAVNDASDGNMWGIIIAIIIIGGLAALLFVFLRRK